MKRKKITYKDNGITVNIFYIQRSWRERERERERERGRDRERGRERKNTLNPKE